MITSGDRAYHIRCCRGEVGRYVLLPGDPGRCALIAQHFDDAKKVAEHREYTTYTGSLTGVRVSVTSTGIGGPSTAIAVEELRELGADTFIRVGTSGAMQPEIQPGDLVIGTAAIRDEGTSRQYLPMEFPAVADLAVTQALIEGAKRAGRRFHVGVIHSKDSFYGEMEPERMPVADELLRRWEAWVQAGALASEMEAATLFIVSGVLKARAGCILLAAANVAQFKDKSKVSIIEDVSSVILAAVEGLRVLIEWDKRS